MKGIFITIISFALFFTLAGDLISASYMAVNDNFVSACLKECTSKKSTHPDCGRESLIFVATQYNYAAGNEPYKPSGELWPCSNGSRTFDCRYWRAKQLHDVCPATYESAKLPKWWDR